MSTFPAPNGFPIGHQAASKLRGPASAPSPLWGGYPLDRPINAFLFLKKMRETFIAPAGLPNVRRAPSPVPDRFAGPTVPGLAAARAMGILLLLMVGISTLPRLSLAQASVGGTIAAPMLLAQYDDEDDDEDDDDGDYGAGSASQPRAYTPPARNNRYDTYRAKRHPPARKPAHRSRSTRHAAAPHRARAHHAQRPHRTTRGRLTRHRPAQAHASQRHALAVHRHAGSRAAARPASHRSATRPAARRHTAATHYRGKASHRKAVAPRSHSNHRTSLKKSGQYRAARHGSSRRYTQQGRHSHSRQRDKRHVAPQSRRAHTKSMRHPATASKARARDRATVQRRPARHGHAAAGKARPAAHTKSTRSAKPGHGQRRGQMKPSPKSRAKAPGRPSRHTAARSGGRRPAAAKNGRTRTTARSSSRPRAKGKHRARR